ncbi:CMP-N,N'-diacetyllegionaminic acid synthase [Lachnospiraceae bacterium NE2001]|nr:CMP-N,N'-diacetyllegionaminic acid synthase [Lachnospiraceae bacterium NE2001]
MRNIAIIPARSGSKGVKDKNIRDLCGKPLMAYSIEAAINSGVFDEVMVSTDSENYAQIAKQFGADVPFLRSETNSSDGASSWDMVDEVLEGYRKIGKEFDTFCLLQPTSPLRDLNDIRKAYQVFTEKAKFAVISVCENEHSPLWSGHLPESGEMDGFIKPNDSIQRQALEKFYRLNGAIYIVDILKFKQDHFIYQKGSYAYIMNQGNSIDIDSEMDFKLAEFFMNSISN